MRPERTQLLVIRAFRGQAAANFLFSVPRRFANRLVCNDGWVAEWFKAPVLKAEHGRPEPYRNIPTRPDFGLSSAQL
jgi:hypothetical protein